MIGNFPDVLNFNRLFLKLNRFICNYLPVLPGHSVGCLNPCMSPRNEWTSCLAPTITYRSQSQIVNIKVLNRLFGHK